MPRWVVEENPIKRRIRIVLERGRSRIGYVATIDNYKVGDRISPPKSVEIEVCGRLNLVANRLERPRYLVKKCNILRNHHNVKRIWFARHLRLSFRMPGLERLIHSQT